MAARNLGTAGEGARLRERHAAEREVYQLQRALSKGARGRLKVVMDAPGSHDAELATATEAIT